MFWNLFGTSDENGGDSENDENPEFIIKLNNPPINKDIKEFIIEVPTDETKYRMRNENALSAILLYTSVREKSHKQWILDLVIKSLVGVNEPGGDDRYNKTIQTMLKAEHQNTKTPIEECTWDEGLTP